MDLPLPGFNEGNNELEAVRKRLAALPIKDPCEALVSCFGQALETLSRTEVASLRRRVVLHFGAEHAFVEIVDGHIALRDIRESV